MCGRTGRCPSQATGAVRYTFRLWRRYNIISCGVRVGSREYGCLEVGNVLGSAVGAHGSTLGVWTDRAAGTAALPLPGSRGRTLHLFGCGVDTTLFRVGLVFVPVPMAAREWVMCLSVQLGLMGQL